MRPLTSLLHNRDTFFATESELSLIFWFDINANAAIFTFAYDIRIMRKIQMQDINQTFNLYALGFMFSCLPLGFMAIGLLAS